MDAGKLHLELIASGCVIAGCDCDGNVAWSGTPNETLADLVIAAHDKALSSSECQALKAYLGAESQEWAAYNEARKAPIKAQRAEAYKLRTDSMLMKAWEASEGATTITIDGVTYRCALEYKIAAWEAEKNAIRAEYPYPED